jgi:hypothetical protein
MLTTPTKQSMMPNLEAQNVDESSDYKAPTPKADRKAIQKVQGQAMSTRRRAAIGASEGKELPEQKNANHCNLAEDGYKSLTEVKKHPNIYKKPYPLSDGSSIKEHLKCARDCPPKISGTS